MASALLGIGGGVSGCVTYPFLTPAVGKVIVIGAGVSGLTAARDLQLAGYDVVVLEGHNRVGGRIHTDRSLGTPVEMGADRIRGTKKNPIIPLIDESGVEYIPFEWNNLSGVASDGTPLDPVKLSTAKPDMLKMLTRAFIRNMGRAGDATVAEIVEKERALHELTPEENEILNFSLGSGEVINGSSFTDTSWKYIRDFEEYDGGDQYVLNGLDAFPKLLANDLDIRKGQTVQAVEYGETGVRVTTQKNEFVADFVVVTVSLGVLQSGSITFSPPLPEKTAQAIEHLGMGQLNKIAIRYPKQFWPTDSHALVHGSDVQGKFVAFINIARYSGQPVLVTMIPASYKAAMTGVETEAVIREAHAVLQGMYGANIPAPIKSVRSDWGTDPFTRGCFSYNRIGARTLDRDDLAESVSGRVFFAGEATHKKKYGSVSGAYISGERAAREVYRATAATVKT